MRTKICLLAFALTSPGALAQEVNEAPSGIEDNILVTDPNSDSGAVLIIPGEDAIENTVPEGPQTDLDFNPALPDVPEDLDDFNDENTTVIFEEATE